MQLLLHNSIWNGSKIFFDQIFRRWNEIELTVDSMTILICANDTVFTAINKCTKSQIITIEYF